MKKQQKLIQENITYVAYILYDGNTYSLPFDPQIEFYNFACIILNNLKLKPDNTSITYKGKIISLMDQRKVTQIIFSNTNPQFEITTTTNKKQKLSGSLKRSFSGTSEQKSSVKITNYLSQDIINTQLNNFYQQKNAQNV